MRAGWWWIDRWRKSTAYTDMTAEEQGVYRNLLDELWLRDGALPKSEKALKTISGDSDAWKRVRETVLARFVTVDGHYRNETHDTIMAESKKRAAKQKRYRDRRGNVTGNVTTDVSPNVPPSPSPSLEQSKDQSPKKDSSANPQKTRMPYTGEFLQFWKAYPRKKNKGDAFKAWKVHSKGNVPEILAGLERAKVSPDWTRDGGTFIPYPASWLRATGWEDEPDEKDNGKPKKREPRTALVPAGHPCHGRKEGELWHDPENPDIKHTIGKDGFWWKREGDRQPIKQEAVFTWHRS